MDLKPLDPQITLKLLEGRKDVITPLADEREAFYRSQSCPHCSGNALQKFNDALRMFVDGDPIARYKLRCDNCGCEFDPHSGIVIKLGNLADAFRPAVPLIDGPDD